MAIVFKKHIEAACFCELAISSLVPLRLDHSANVLAKPRNGSISTKVVTGKSGVGLATPPQAPRKHQFQPQHQDQLSPIDPPPRKLFMITSEMGEETTLL
ncbi:hypothetical protein PoB_006343900 [Plakobranchus ocellatus]|uniref:Uncharacterized protein n=1 Tax=Plakobranchus ocellatus TaxID=259542 RepID=A0AAV4CYM0_9GAST|nr:hypothetical protein PoB_006343900 [Plakobranchus ocellatus]